MSLRLTQLLCAAGGGLEEGELGRRYPLEPQALSFLLKAEEGRSVSLASRLPPPVAGPQLLEGPRSPEAERRMVLARSAMRLCQEQAGSCLGQCGQLHLCRYFIYGNCRNQNNKNPCKFIHSIHLDHNLQVLLSHGLQALREDDVRQLLLQNDPSLLPEICMHYNRGDGPYGSCAFKKSCIKLHVCQHYLQGDCRFGSSCKRTHNLCEGDCLEMLDKWGLSLSLIHKLPSVYRNAFDIRNSSSYTPPPLSPSQNKEGILPFVKMRKNSTSNEGSEEICLFNIRKSCSFQDKCLRVHFHLPYRWQVYSENMWKDIKDMETIEKAYCDPNNRVGIPRVNFQSMTYNGSKIRRLSTVSSVSKPPHFILTTEWLWYWKDEYNHWIEYGQKNDAHPGATVCSSDLEKAFLADECSTLQFKAGKQDYELRFKDMLQKNVHYGTKREICRRPKFVSVEDVEKKKTRGPDSSQEGFKSIPPYWDKTQLTEVGYELVKLSSNSEEFKKVQALFHRTLPTCAIQSIQRIQNLALWEVYQWQKEQMKKSSNGKDVDERHLFHGTNEKLVDAICLQNFDWRICGAHGTAYGKGSYFAKDASYSHNYSSRTDSNSRIMFVARVLVGEFVQGKFSFLRPPPKDCSTSFYNSCVDSEVNPNIFVIFEKHQIYPEYLIKYVEQAAYAHNHVVSAGIRHSVRGNLN
ncbi:protein mono-ADP-ribosyltransferase PARP12 isoform X1 [Microcaecilia unicolor]|uniref:Protein mono-ADP-ribosyltransferase PARP12-like isoform X1 n=1 Tax=Microcaecilia unicolor TaxID=1415580 RepID=A0A6P7Z118_9AMPH|nr:protein mono-ADP-ribosyltransferase PARP12-like isoform X1 [Microcaecilia unicolor]